MTKKYTLPSVEEIIELARTEEGRDSIISDFRTRTDNLSIEEALIIKERLDSEVGKLVQRIADALEGAYRQEDCELEDRLYDLKNDVITLYGYDSYTDGTWVNSNY